MWILNNSIRLLQTERGNLENQKQEALAVIEQLERSLETAELRLDQQKLLYEKQVARLDARISNLMEITDPTSEQLAELSKTLEEREIASEQEQKAEESSRSVRTARSNGNINAAILGAAIATILSR